MPTRTFRLYPEERHWCSFADYGAILDIVERLRPRTVLEFGPGSSTLALIEGGAEAIDACEDDPRWFAAYRERLAEFPAVAMQAYNWHDPIRIPQLDGRRYDLALIDGPKQTERRAPAIEYALQRSAAVLVPTEEWRGFGPRPDLGLRGVVAALASQYGRAVEIMETGPLAGAYALMTSP